MYYLQCLALLAGYSQVKMEAKEKKMNPSCGFTQEQLDDIWDSLDGDDPYPSAKRVVDDVEQVMTIDTTNGQASVSRKPGDEWYDTPSVGDKFCIGLN